MKDVFITIVNLSITASYAAVLVIIARWALKRLKLPTLFAYLLWTIVFIRLIMPLSFESPVSMMPGNTNVIPHQITTEAVPKIDSGIPSVDLAVNGVIEAVIPAATPVHSVNPIDVILYVMAMIWVVGIVILFSYATFSYIRLRRRLATATRVKGHIFESEHIQSPFVLGILKPRIYLPLGLSHEQFHYIVEHEQTHIRRLDHITKPVAFLITVLHWFNPIVWLSYSLAIKDMEMSCDESVMKRSTGDARAAYSYILLAMASKQRTFIGPLSFGESDVKARIRNIMSYKKTALWVACIIAAILLILATSMLSNPLKAKDSADPYEQLWESRTEYIGNAGKVSTISGHLNYPKPFQYDHIELQTKSEPYGLTIYIAADESAVEQLAITELLAMTAPEFHRNALLLFGLIGNVDEIAFQVTNNEQENNLFYTREWAQQRVQETLLASTKEKEDFVALAQHSEQLMIQDQVVRAAELFGDQLKSAMLLVPEEQLKEQIDQLYAPYVSNELIGKWKEQLELTPGRELSSPWPERLDVLSITKLNDETYKLHGQIVEVAGGEVVGTNDVNLLMKIETDQWKIDSFEYLD